jgi:hypothetical protein
MKNKFCWGVFTVWITVQKYCKKTPTIEEEALHRGSTGRIK